MQHIVLTFFFSCSATTGKEQICKGFCFSKLRRVRCCEPLWLKSARQPKSTQIAPVCFRITAHWLTVHSNKNSFARCKINLLLWLQLPRIKQTELFCSWNCLFFLLLDERSGNVNEFPCKMSHSVTSRFASQQNGPNTVFARDHVSFSAEGSDCVASSPLCPAGATPSRAELKMKYFLNKE